MSLRPKILVADDEKELRESLCSALSAMGFDTEAAADGEEALAKIHNGTFTMAILDVLMPQKTGLEVLKEIKEFDPSIIVLVITAHGNLKDAVEAIRLGAFNYIEKPVKENHLKELLDKAAKAQSAVRNIAFSSPRLTLENGQIFVGHSQQMKSVFALIERLTKVSTSVLIRGENGTGKELVAHAIHLYGPRKDKRFVVVNCGAIPENLMESELFGHEKGSFTGANARHIGKFQYAEGGTLFLDEIGELPLSMQVKLLRVLQDRSFTPVGSNREIKCDIRIIAATNRDLEAMIRNGHFRQDLFYRLNVMPIFLASLRDRTEEIPALVDHFIEKFNQLHSRNILGITDDALLALKEYSWPGNIRELENTIERAFVLELGDRITINALPEHMTGINKTEPEITHTIDITNGKMTESKSSDFDFQHEKETFERRFIVNALKRYNGRINQTVENANIPKNTLLRKMRKYNIQPWEYESQ